MCRIAFERDRDWKLANKQRQIMKLEEMISDKKLLIEEHKVMIEQLKAEMEDILAVPYHHTTLA